MASVAESPEAAHMRNADRTGWWLLGGCVVFLTAAGLLLWARDGAAVFGDYVLAGLAWCF